MAFRLRLLKFNFINLYRTALKRKASSDGDLLKLGDVLLGAGETTLEAASTLASVTAVPGDLE